MPSTPKSLRHISGGKSCYLKFAISFKNHMTEPQLAYTMNCLDHQNSIHHDCIPCEIELPMLRITYQQLNSHWYGHWIMSTIKVYLGNIMQGKSPLHVSHLYILTHSHFTNESLLSKHKIHQYLKVIYIIKILMYIDRSSTPHLNCKWTMDSVSLKQTLHSVCDPIFIANKGLFEGRIPWRSLHMKVGLFGTTIRHEKSNSFWVHTLWDHENSNSFIMKF